MFTEKERLLANEAALASSLLGNGLNALRRADLYNKGLYYQAFFSLSIGLERLFKIIVINQYRVSHNEAFPMQLDLKKLSHNLTKLCEHTGIIFEVDTLHSKIIEFLSDFAMKSRYYNVDSMLNSDLNYKDPLSDWYVICRDILNSSKKKKSIQHKQELAFLLDSVSLFRFSDLQGSEITNAIGFLDDLETKDIIQSYSVQFMFEIIVKLVNEINQLESKRYMLPVLSEFFRLFHDHWKASDIRKKKDWLRL